MIRANKKRGGRFGIMRRPRILFLWIFVSFAAPGICMAAMSVAQSKHNLSATGPGTIKSPTETEICVFCHTPHNAQPVGVLWNRQDPTAVYNTYDSTTIQAFIGQPTGASRLCLSCHDGTIALGKVSSRAIEIMMTQQFLNTGFAALTTDLSDDHPISFVYDSSLSASNPEYEDPSTLIDEVTLDSNNQLQCTSCHDPHDNSNGYFLHIYNSYSALCLVCHKPTGWFSSSHKLSTSTWNGSLPDPWLHTEWNSVDANACESCHRPHSAGGAQRLMNELTEEDNCFPCHNGNVAFYDIQSEFFKSSTHAVANTTAVHDPAENPLTASRHVECSDCHNPHQVNGAPASAPVAKGPLMGVTGLDGSGVPVENASFEYEICYKCHADNNSGVAPVARQLFELNKRLIFDLSSPSYHPVEGVGQNPNVPSLLTGYNTASIIYCTDCHSNNDGPGAGGLGPSGPHGSQWDFLLERQYRIADNTAESSANYALCYKCHNRSSILSDESFPLHRLHIVDELTPCSVCHDPHGISSALGNPVNNSNLINFDITVVFPNSQSALEFVDGPMFTGSCSLTCHGRDHIANNPDPLVTGDY